MLNVLWWLITVEALGLAVFPLAYYLFRRLPDRGFSVTKPLGILLVGYIAWILGALNIVPVVRVSLIVIMVLVASGSAWVAWHYRDELKKFVSSERKTLIASEIIFLVFFIGWTLFRAYDPAIDHTEQPMDFAFLNASIETTYGQPEDPWLRGETISYYYFGYWMFGAVSEISGVPSNYAYNLSLALIPALGAVGLFGLVFSIVRSEGARWKFAVFTGVAAGVVLGIVGNLEGVLEFMRANAIGGQGFYDWLRIDGLDGPAVTPTESWTPEDFWWWFRATRVINTFQDGVSLDYTIHEFPSFSFILGDLHPHVSAIPFAILFLAFAWNFYRSELPDFSRLSIRTYLMAGAMALSLGGLAFTNMWDLPTYAVLLLGIVALKAYPIYQGRILPILGAMAQFPMIVIALALILFMPYYISLTASVEGIGAVDTTTRYPHMFIVWGVPMILVGPFIVASFWQTVVGTDWRRMTLYALIVGFLPYAGWIIVRLQSDGESAGPIGRLIHIMPLALLVGMGVFAAISVTKERGSSGKAFALLLATLGLLLIMGPELLFVDDFFGPPSERMNTIFKLYYQAWLLLAAASGFAIYYWRSGRDALVGWKRSLSTLWAVGTVILVVGALYYPAAASTSKAVNFTDPTLNGLNFLERGRNAEYAAIQFVRDELGGDDAILEAVGEWFDSGLISRSTGVPTVFNWPGHQIQWRGSDESFSGREQDVASIYETIDPLEARNLLAKYDVDYVYLGPREREKYGDAGLAKFTEFMDSVFSQDNVEIYRVRQ
jgi:YYY domain-containing protein